MPENETVLLEELVSTIQLLGRDATIHALKNARSKSLSLEDKRVEFVLKMISEHYCLSIEEIINSHNKSNKRMTALKLSIYYLYDVFDIGLSDLGQVFKRHKSLLSRSAKEMRQMITENNYINNLDINFNLLIKDFKTKNNL